MSCKFIFVFIILCIVIFLQAVSLGANAEIVDEFTGSLTYSYPLVSSASSYAMSVDITGSPTVSEIQLPLAIYSGYTGSVLVELCEDSGGVPSETSLMEVGVGLSELPMHYDGAQWISFTPSSSIVLSPGTHWIICKTSTGSNANVLWYCPEGYDNLYGSWHDTKKSLDGGQTWDGVMLDFYFKIFGARVASTTITGIEATPSDVEVSNSSIITVTVRDEDDNPCQGIITLSADGGTFDSNSHILNHNGTAWANWYAPNDLDTYTITANFGTGQGYDGLDYVASSNDIDVTVSAFTGLRDTSTVVALSKGTVKTHEQITVTATVTDLSGVPVTVDAGEIAFRADGGSFSSYLESVAGGTANVTWTAPDVAGTYTIYAYYQGYYSSGNKFKSSNGNSNAAVEYRDFNTITTLTVSPTHPYINKSTYVIAEVKEHISSDALEVGIVRFSVQDGTFLDNDIAIVKGRAVTQWTAPSYDGAMNITATFSPDAPYIAKGERYFSSADNKNAEVTKDYDSEGTELTWMSQWVSNYDDSPLPNAGPQVQGFTNALEAIDWDGSEFSNGDARAKRMRGLPIWNEENSYLDKHDFTIYNGHGNPDFISFLGPWYDSDLDVWETLDAGGNPTWGDKDAEWVALKTCVALSNPDHWAASMDGLHLICGFHTNAESDPCFGKVFANFMIQDTADDRPFTVRQSWFLAGDITHRNDKSQRVIGEVYENGNDYLWGQGPVSGDPSPSNTYVSWFHQIANNTPVADAGGPYYVTIGQPVVLDSSGTTDVDTYESSRNYFKWDMDVTVSSDSNDYDRDGINETDDDMDCYGATGKYPSRYVYNVPGTYIIRLMVSDDTGNRHSAASSVVVTVPPPGPAPPSTNGMDAESLFPEGGPEIVDNFNPMELPTEPMLPMFQMMDTQLGYTDMLNLADDFGGMESGAFVDSMGNWTMVRGNNVKLINQYTGAVMCIDKSSAYDFSGPPPTLPTDGQAKTIADNFLGMNGMLMPDVNFMNVTQICQQDMQKSNYNQVISSAAYQKRVNYARYLNVLGKNYPVVGPGGMITVLIDSTSDVRMFVKIWRELAQGGDMGLIGTDIAVQRFHELVQDALIKGSKIPICERIEIDKVSLGYYEDNFYRYQEWVPPVYILDLTCYYQEYSEKTTVYIAAMAEPLDAGISSPNDKDVFDINTPIMFTGTVSGGTGPYTYRWTSDVDGVLSSSASFSMSDLSLRRFSDPNVCENLAHTISFTVTDSYGLESSELIQVNIYQGCSDFNHDNEVDFEDFAKLAFGWLANNSDTNYQDELDINNDLIIDTQDLKYLADEWLK